MAAFAAPTSQMNGDLPQPDASPIAARVLEWFRTLLLFSIIVLEQAGEVELLASHRVPKAPKCALALSDESLLAGASPRTQACTGVK